jgi:hypothetical protein
MNFRLVAGRPLRRKMPAAAAVARIGLAGRPAGVFVPSLKRGAVGHFDQTGRSALCSVLLSVLGAFQNRCAAVA